MRAWLMIGLLGPASALAQQEAVAHQGRLLDGSGTPLNGSYSLTLSLMDDASAGASILTRTETVQVSDGYFAVILSGVDSTSLDGDRWLAVIVDGTELLPRQALGSVAQAVHASGAQLGDLDVVCDNTTTAWHGTLRFRDDRFEGCTPDGWSPLSL